VNFPESLLEFERLFCSEDQCREYLLGLRFPNGFICPRCHGIKHWPQSRFRLTCATCKHEVSPFAGTVFHKSHISLMIWFRAIWWFTNQKSGISALGLQRALGLGSYRTAWLMLHKLRTAMLRPGRERLKGEVEADETWVGGVQSGPEARYKKLLVLIVAEKDGRKIGRIRMKLIPDTNGSILVPAIQDLVEPGTRVETDGWWGYTKISDIGYKHVRTITNKDVREEHMLPRVHKVASLLKRALMGTYHGKWDAKHFQSYLDEFVFRFNRRTSRSRGLLFQRVLENAIQVDPIPYGKIKSRTRPKG
jgi:hypothetical protein